MEKTKKVSFFIQAIFFIASIFTPILISAIFPQDFNTVSRSENRMLAKRPLFEVSLLDPYPKRYENFYNDHFLFRSQLMSYNSFINYFFFHQSPNPKMVVAGRDGWLFYANRERMVYEGTKTIKAYEVQSVVEELHRRTLFLKRKGIPLYVVMAPMKSDIYFDFLPPYYKRAAKSIPEMLISAIRKDTVIHLIDLKPGLVEARKKHRIYYKTDTHWNSRGAFQAYSMIMDRLKEDFPCLKPMTPDDVGFEEYKYHGLDLATTIGLEKFIPDTVCDEKLKKPRAVEGRKAGYPPSPYFGYPDLYEIVMEVADTTLPRVVVIRDSYFRSVIPFFSQHFSKSVYIFDNWDYGANYSIIMNEKPDLVLLEVLGSNSANLLQNQTK